MGVNISGSGILSGIASLIVGAVNNLNLLVTRIIGYTTGGGGGSSYYTTMVGSIENGFVTATSGVGVMYSIDGINWTKSFSYTGIIHNFRYENNKFFLLASDNTFVSEDGVTWTEITLPVEATFNSVMDIKYGLVSGVNPLYVAYKQGDNSNILVFSSPDLQTWDTKTISNFHSPTNIMFDSSYNFHLVGHTQRDVSGSTVTDINYAKNSDPYNNAWSSEVIDTINGPAYASSIAHASGSLVITDVSNDTYYHSSLLDPTWNKHQIPTGKKAQEVFSSGNYFFFIGLDTIMSANANSLNVDNELVLVPNQSSTPGFFGFSLKNGYAVNENGTVVIINSTFAREPEGTTAPFAYLATVGNYDNFQPSYSMLAQEYPNLPSYDSTSLRAIVYLDGKFVATGSYASAYSIDGNIWNKGNLTDSTYSKLVTGQISTLVETQISIGNQGEEGAEILAPVDVYTVPANKTTDIDEVRIKNNSGNTITYDLAVLNNGIELTDQNALINDQAVLAGATATVTSITTPMTAGQRIVVFPSAVDVVEVKVYGTETVIPNNVTIDHSNSMNGFATVQNQPAEGGALRFRFATPAANAALAETPSPASNGWIGATFTINNPVPYMGGSVPSVLTSGTVFTVISSSVVPGGGPMPTQVYLTTSNTTDIGMAFDFNGTATVVLP